jgi:hypothetical protein
MSHASYAPWSRTLDRVIQGKAHAGMALAARAQLTPLVTTHWNGPTSRVLDQATFFHRDQLPAPSRTRTCSTLACLGTVTVTVLA